MNASPITSVARRNIATTGSASRLAGSVEKVPLAMESSITALNANVLKDTLDQLSVNADQSAMEMLTARDRDQLASMESVRIHVTVLVVSTLIATSAD